MKKIQIQNSIALVSGANRGIGKAITEELLNKGVKKVYAGARKKESLNELTEKYGERVIALQLDVTDQKSVNQAAEIASDANVIINNAGVLSPGGYRSETMVESLKNNMEVNVLGVARLTQATIPNLKKQSGQTSIATVASIAGLANMPMENAYSASKAAAHSIIQGLRAELEGENVNVAGIYPGPVDTDMIKPYEGFDKVSPEVLAKNVVEGIENGDEYIFPDPMATQFGEAYSNSPKDAEKMLSEWK